MPLGRSESDVKLQSLQEFFSHPFLAPGELLPSSPVSSPDASLALQHPASLPTIASGIMLPLSGPSSSGEEQLPFAMERQPAAGPPPRAPAGLVRMASEPPTPVGKQVVVQQPRQQREAFFTGQHLIYQLKAPLAPQSSSPWDTFCGEEMPFPNVEGPAVAVASQNYRGLIRKAGDSHNLGLRWV